MTGIYRATPLRTNPRQRTVKAVYKTYIDVIHFRKTDTKRLRGREDEDPDDDGVQRQTFTAERVEQLKQLSQTPDIYERLARALGGCGLVMVDMSTHTTSSTCTPLSHAQCTFVLTHTHTHTHTHTAPSIYENDDIKKGILLQMFGGTRKDFQNAGRGKFRAEVNILLCGDPGTSKSQLLQVCVSVTA